MSITEARKSFECETVIKFMSRFRKLKKKSHNDFLANGWSMHLNLSHVCHF